MTLQQTTTTLHQKLTSYEMEAAIQGLGDWRQRCKDNADKSLDWTPHWAGSKPEGRTRGYLATVATPKETRHLKALYSHLALMWGRLCAHTVRDYDHAKEDELISLSYDMVCRVLSTYDPERGELGAHVYYNVRRDLHDYYTRQDNAVETREVEHKDVPTEQKDTTDYAQMIAEAVNEGALYNDLTTA